MRRHCTRFLILRVLAVMTLAAPMARPAAAEDFRVETQIYVGDKEEPASTNVTRFKGSVVWDFAGDGSEIVMFDKARGRFAMLDLQRKMRTEVTTGEVMQFTQQLRDWANGQDDPLLKFCATPRFEPTGGSTSKTLKFKSPLLSYEIETERPDKPEIAARYREFSDWYARVNTLFRPGLLPPFPRLLVNEQLAREQMVPQRVQLTLAPQPSHGNKQVTVRSEQSFVYGLLESDLEKIDKAAGYLVTLRNVSLAAYRGDETAAAPAKQAK
ncbi:MAG: hypothetical protein K8T91_01135 [Planctomycetes bacterium]|nr:hypothetical protein [Planctomycetota bacterium]